LAHKCRTIANHGRISKYDHCLEGRNSRLDGIQAAILDVKLKHLDSWIKRRNVVAGLYIQELKDIPYLVLPEISPQMRHSFHLFVIRTNRRDKLQKFLLDTGIETGIHYPIALPKLSAYSYLNQETAAFKACALDSQLLSLPMGEHLTDEEVNVVVGAVRGFMSSVSRRRGTACRAPTA
jgi:dTDP-4-amino-4,6-dideoxygalactose transaminase